MIKFTIHHDSGVVLAVLLGVLIGVLILAIQVVVLVMGLEWLEGVMVTTVQMAFSCKPTSSTLDVGNVRQS